MMDEDRRKFLKLAAGASAAAAFKAPALAGQPQSASGDLTALSLWDAAELIRTRKVSAVELTTASLARIERLNPALNAFITVMRDQALADAKAADGEIARDK